MKLTAKCVFIKLLILIKLCSATSQVSRSLAKCREYSEDVDCTMHLLSDAPTTATGLGAVSDFPHLGVISFKRDLTETFVFLFGLQGSLISRRYVITFAGGMNRSDLIPFDVRFGLASDREDSKSVAYNIEKVIMHPNYRAPSLKNDIALLKLVKRVEFTENIRPICLPDSDTALYTIVYRVNYNERLVKYRTQIVMNDICNVLYKTVESIDSNSVCVTAMDFGVHNSRFNGAPIVIDHPNEECSRMLIGVFGAGFKVRVADAAIKIYNYLDWIENIIWADGEDD